MVARSTLPGATIEDPSQTAAVATPGGATTGDERRKRRDADALGARNVRCQASIVLCSNRPPSWKKAAMRHKLWVQTPPSQASLALTRCAAAKLNLWRITPKLVARTLEL